MEEIVYLSVRIGCAGYLLYKLWNQKKRIRKICGLLYPPGKKEKEEEGTSCGTGSGDVMGATRFVYLDENAGTFAAPYMSQPLETGNDYLGEEEAVPDSRRGSSGMLPSRARAMKSTWYVMLTKVTRVHSWTDPFWKAIRIPSLKV